jgi:hypothetical protein
MKGIKNPQVYVYGFLGEVLRITNTHLQVRFGNGKIGTYPKKYKGIVEVDLGVEVGDLKDKSHSNINRNNDRPTYWLGMKDAAWWEE